MATDARPRGIRNHNPGNIRPTGIAYLGIVKTDPDPRYGDYLVFCDDLHGIRAIAACLIAYKRRHAIDTVKEAISRWAPPADGNPTDAYIGNVCQALGVTSEEIIDLTSPEVLAGIIPCIIHQECGLNNGQPWFSDDLIRKAIAMVVA